MELTPNALKVLKKRCLHGTESPNEMFDRIARHIASVEKTKYLRDKWTTKFYEVMVDLLFLPNSPTLRHAGATNGNLAACFVLPIEDSRESIFKTLSDAAHIQSSGGGSGYDFSKLRPKGSAVGNRGAFSSGPISFMEVYDFTIGEVIRQGGVRFGAQMGTMRCLSGDTLIHTIDGKKKIKDLVGKKPYVYACSTKDKRVKIVQAADVFVSDRNREMVRVWLDNGNYIDCTPDHKFMLSSGKYKRADGLKLGNSLMAFSRYICEASKKGRYLWKVCCTGGKPEWEHRVLARDVFYKKINFHKNNVHHIDGDPLNNNPLNISIISRRDHANEHVKALNIGLIKDNKNRKGKTLEETYGKEVADRWRSNMCGTRKGRIPWNKGLSGDEYKKHYSNGFGNQVSNHKVVKVERIDKAKKVYDISLPKYHNFAAEEIFVHNCDHPDIMQFIRAKRVEGRLQNFNISVTITDEFMGALRTGNKYTLKWNDKEYGDVDAKEIWDEIINGAWENGEPGVIFIDTVNFDNPLKEVELIETSNPCSEEPLPPYNVCNLGSIDLSKLLDSNCDGFDLKEVEKIVRIGVRFLDNVIAINNYPIPEVEAASLYTRRIGLGIMGFADALIMMGIKYSSPEAINIAADIGSYIRDIAYDESENIGEEKGYAPVFDDIKARRKRRNGTVTTVAPTGSLSIIADCSSGIEPNFDVAYDKIALDGKLSMVPRLWRGKENLPDHYETMKDIPVRQHVNILEAFQWNLSDSGVSKTINAPNHITREEVDAAFRAAYEKGCKAVTFYRDGSRVVQAQKSIERKRERKKIINGITEQVRTGYGQCYVTMNYLDKNDLFEVFINMGQSGRDVHCMSEALGRLISIARRSNVPVEEIVKQLKGIGGEKPIITRDGTVRSIPDAVARSIEANFCSHIIEGEEGFRNLCPNCGEDLQFAEGCMRCLACGFDKCG